MLITQFEVLPGSKVLRTPGGQKRKHRARERKPGMLLQTASHLGYIKTTTLPPFSRVSLATNCSHIPRYAQNFRPKAPIFCNPSHPQIWTVGSPDPMAQVAPRHPTAHALKPAMELLPPLPARAPPPRRQHSGRPASPAASISPLPLLLPSPPSSPLTSPS